jgi:hypothetical protein
MAGVGDFVERHQAQIASAASARLSNPRTYWRELAVAPRILQPDEDLLDLFSTYYGRFSLMPGILVEATHRLVFISLGLIRRRPIIRSIPFEEIESGTVDSLGGDPQVKLRTTSGKVVTLRRARPDRKQFPDLVRTLEQRLGAQLDTSASPVARPRLW